MCINKKGGVESSLHHIHYHAAFGRGKKNFHSLATNLSQGMPPQAGEPRIKKKRGASKSQGKNGANQPPFMLLLKEREQKRDYRVQKGGKKLQTNKASHRTEEGKRSKGGVIRKKKPRGGYRNLNNPRGERS